MDQDVVIYFSSIQKKGFTPNTHIGNALGVTVKLVFKQKTSMSFEKAVVLFGVIREALYLCNMNE
jgi:hypothetical protein